MWSNAGLEPLNRSKQREAVLVEDRRRADDKNWDEIKTFIEESRTYRATDKLKQEYQIASMEALNERVKIQNGRVGRLEDWKKDLESGVKNKKDSQATTQAVITIVATIIMALAAVAMYFKH